MEENQKMSFVEANDLVTKRAEELSLSNNITVLPLLFETEKDWCIGYFKSPTRMQTMSVLGKGGVDPLFSGEALLIANLIKNESDFRFLNDSPLYDEINIGAFLEAYASANKISKNLAEKKIGK